MTFENVAAGLAIAALAVAAAWPARSRRTRGAHSATPGQPHH